MTMDPENMSSGVDDPDLLDEEDAHQAPTTRAVKRGRGRPRKNAAKPKEEPIVSQRRPFIESEVGKEMAKTDITTMMNAWDWDSGEYSVSVQRVQPKNFRHQNTFGYVGSVSHSIDAQYIKDNWGGGIYDLVVHGPSVKTGRRSSFLQGCRVKVAGDPILPEDEDIATDSAVYLATPQAGPVNMAQARRARRVGSWLQRSDGGDGSIRGSGDSDSMVKMSMEMMAKQAKEASNEAASLRNQLVTQGTRKNGSDPVNRELIQVVQTSADRAIESERRAARRDREDYERMRKEELDKKKDFDLLLDRMGRQHPGIPAEMLQGMAEQHRAELNSFNESHRAQLLQERERADREVATIRERYEREVELLREHGRNDVSQVRNELQSRLDREYEYHRTELSRMKDEYNKELKLQQERSSQELERTRDDFSRKEADEKKEFLRQLDSERARSKNEYEMMENRTRTDRESMVNQHNMQVEHIKSLNAGQVSQITSQFEGQISQLTSQHEVSMKMQDNTFQSRITSLENELTRTRRDLELAQAKVSEHGDWVEQATKIKKVGESLQGVFGFAGGANAITGQEEREEQKGWLGALVRFADTRFGEGLTEVFKQVVVSAMSGQPHMQVPSALPGAQYSYGVPGQVPPQYHQYYQQPPQQSYQPSIPQEEADEEYEDEEEYEVAPSQEAVEQTAVPQPKEEPRVNLEEDEKLTSRVDNDGVIRAEVPLVSPGLTELKQEKEIKSRVSGDGVVRAKVSPPYVPAKEVVKKQPSVEESKQQQSVQQPPQQSTQQPGSVANLPPALKEQIKIMILGIEESMKNGVSAVDLAKSFVARGGAEQLLPFAQVPTAELIEQMRSIVPETMLVAYNGRKYLAEFQKNLYAAIVKPQ